MILGTWRHGGGVGWWVSREGGGLGSGLVVGGSGRLCGGAAFSLVLCGTGGSLFLEVCRKLD